MLFLVKLTLTKCAGHVSDVRAVAILVLWG